MKRSIIAALAAASVLGLSACGSGSPSSTGAGTASGAAAENAGLTKVTVGVIPIVDCAPIYLGDKKGFFKEEGLQLDIQTATGGAAIVPGVVSGSFDFAFSNTVVVPFRTTSIRLALNDRASKRSFCRYSDGSFFRSSSSDASTVKIAGRAASLA